MCMVGLKLWSKTAPIHYIERKLIEGVSCFYQKSATLWLFFFYLYKAMLQGFKNEITLHIPYSRLEHVLITKNSLQFKVEKHALLLLLSFPQRKTRCL